MRKVTKAVIPVAGLGTRVLPASKAIPKEMLPIVDKPAIQYVVEEAAMAGIEQILLVSRAGKESIENHFDRQPELEDLLSSKNKDAILRSVTGTCPNGVEILSIRQDQPKGLGHAVLCARKFCGDEPFVVMLPDVLVFAEDQPQDLKTMLDSYQNSGLGQILVEAVPEEKVHLYGIADCSNPAQNLQESTTIQALVEKPDPGTVRSNLAVVGRYILPPEIMPILESTNAGAGGEIQLTDAMQVLLQSHPLQAFTMAGKTFDCGNKLGYLLANLYVGLHHPETADGLRREMRQGSI